MSLFSLFLSAAEEGAAEPTLWQEIRDYLYRTYFYHDFTSNKYLNFGRGIGFSVVIFSLCLGFLIAFFCIRVQRNRQGRLIRALLRAQAFSEETAQTPEELGLSQSRLLTSALRRPSALRKLVVALLPSGRRLEDFRLTDAVRQTGETRRRSRLTGRVIEETPGKEAACPEEDSAAQAACPQEDLTAKEACPEEASAAQAACAGEASVAQAVCPQENLTEKEARPGEASATQAACLGEASVTQVACSGEASAAQAACSGEASATQATCLGETPSLSSDSVSRGSENTPEILPSDKQKGAAAGYCDTPTPKRSLRQKIRRLLGFKGEEEKALEERLGYITAEQAMSARYYIPEETRIRAELRYGADSLKTAAIVFIVIGVLILPFVLMRFLPDLVRLLDVIMRKILG